MLWIAAATACRACYAGCNVLDSHYRHYFSSAVSQLFYCNLYWVAAMPLLLIVAQPALPAAHLWPWIAVSGFFGALYLVPYFAAIRTADSSVTAALFAFGRIFTPIFAVVLVAEQLSASEIAGFLVTVAGAVYLSWKPGAMRFDMRSLLLMGASGAMSALGMVCSKHVFNHMATLDGFLWITVATTVVIAGLIIVPGWQQHILRDKGQFPKIYIGFSSTFFLGMTANFFAYLTVALTKPSYAAMFGQFQPFFVLAIMAVAGNGGKLRALEDLSGRVVVQKLAAFTIITSGMAIALWPEA